MKKRKILVVDDSEIVLAMAREALEGGGFEVVTALSAKEADIYIFGQDKPDLIILDVMLPMLDGDKKAKMLKENELTKDIPILLLSSKPEEELRYLVKESGADGFVRKPFTDQQMVKKAEDTICEKLVHR
ncbi:MAG: response regulator [Geobacteraceae bacterium]|nr:MAG: response regulator [Geobacteraceae bacterium]